MDGRSNAAKRRAVSPATSNMSQSNKKPREQYTRSADQEERLSRDEVRKQQADQRCAMNATNKEMAKFGLDDNATSSNIGRGFNGRTYSLVPPSWAQSPGAGSSAATGVSQKPLAPPLENNTSLATDGANERQHQSYFDLSTYSKDKLIELVQNWQAEAKDAKARVLAGGVVMRNLINDLDRSRIALEAKTANTISLEMTNATLRAQLKASEPAETTRLKNDLIAQNLTYSTEKRNLQYMLNMKDTDIHHVKQEQSKLRKQVAELQQSNDNARLLAYKTGKDLMQSEIGTLKRKVTALEGANAELSGKYEASMRGLVEAVQFARAEIRFLLGDTYECPYLGTGDGLIDIEKAFEVIRKARAAVEQ